MNQQETKDVTIRHGYWFFFEQGPNKIAIHGSSISGMETIYLNDEIVSKKRSYKFKSEHEFSIDGDIYSVVFKMTNWLRGELCCSLFKGAELITTETKAYYQKNNKLLIVSSLVCGLAAGFIFAYFAIKFFK